MIRRMWPSDEGTAAVEFALIVPVLATMVLGISQGSDILVGSSRMQMAARSSIQYILNGGSSLTTAESVGLDAWDNKPSDAAISASEYCTCSGATAVCTTTCSDGSVPYQYISATVTGTLGGTVYNVHKSLTETARIR